MSVCSLDCASGVSGKAQVPSITLLTQSSKICASFMVFVSCCILANIGKACSILGSMRVSTNRFFKSSTTSSDSEISAGDQDSKY